MKKLFFIAAIASAAIVSCTKNEPATTLTEQEEITFEAPIIGAATKVDLISTYPTSLKFGVYGLYYTGAWTGYSDGVKYMDNVEVTYKAAKNGWSAAGYYWPKTSGSTMTFSAYSPYMTSGVSHTANGIQFTDYTVPAAANVDLLFSDRTYNQTKTTEAQGTNPYYGVDITFNHALSAVLFQAKAAAGLTGNTDTPNYEFVITKIEVVGAKTTGTFNQSLVDNTTGPTTPNASTSDWSTTTATGIYTAYSGDGIKVASTNPVSAHTSNTGKADLILMPQSLTGVKVKVTYKFRHDRMDTGKYIDGNVVEANLSYDVDDDTNDVTSWIRGKRYIYTLTIGLDEIYFAPIMDNWDDVTVPVSEIL